MFSILQDLKNLKKYSKERLPIIFFRDGGPPIPDFSTTYLSNIDELSVSPKMDKIPLCYFDMSNLIFSGP